MTPHLAWSCAGVSLGEVRSSGMVRNGILEKAGSILSIILIFNKAVGVRVCPRAEPGDRRTGVDPRDRVPFVGLDL